jgi:hypothetical protein
LHRQQKREIGREREREREKERERDRGSSRKIAFLIAAVVGR